jgi:DNA-directed RNA polymerase specialized sigma subunit
MPGLQFPGPYQARQPSTPSAPDLHVEAYKTWASSPRGPQDNTAVLNSLQPIINNAVRSFGGANASPRLHTEAKRIVLDVLPRYDQKSSTLKTYLTSHLQGLRRIAGQDREPLAVPERVAMDRDYIRRGQQELRSELGRHPSDAELSDHLGMPLHRISDVRSYQPGLSEGFVEQRRGEGDQAPGVAVEGPGDNHAWQEMVYHSVSPTDQIIMEHTLQMHGREPLSNQQIAAKLGVSPGAVSQRRTRIQSMLDNNMLQGREGL